MLKLLSAKDFDKVVSKFGMRSRDTGDHHAWLEVEGKTVVRTKRSHGNKGAPFDFVRKQLHLTSDQLRGAVDCSLDLADYIRLLRSTGKI